MIGTLGNPCVRSNNRIRSVACIPLILGMLTSAVERGCVGERESTRKKGTQQDKQRGEIWQRIVGSREDIDKDRGTETKIQTDGCWQRVHRG